MNSHRTSEPHSCFFPFGFFFTFLFLFVSLLTESNTILLPSLSFSVLFQLSRLCFLCFTNYKGFLSLLSLFMSLCSIKWCELLVISSTIYLAPAVQVFYSFICGIVTITSLIAPFLAPILAFLSRRFLAQVRFSFFSFAQRKVRWLLRIWIKNEERNREEDDKFSIMFGVVVPVGFFFFFEKGFSCPCSWIIHLKFKYYQTHQLKVESLFSCSNMSHWQVQCVIS